jgi:hypothetical protein
MTNKSILGWGDNKTIAEQAFYYHDGWHTRSERHYRKNDPQLIAWAYPPKGWKE